MKPLNNIDKNLVIHADNLETLKSLSGVSFRMIYIDPPFNTGHTQKKETLVTKRSEDGSGTRTGFGGRKYSSTKVSEFSYEDSFDDYIEGFLGPRLLEAWNLLSEDGTIYVHLDFREVHYVKVWMDKTFGRDKFLNELIWAYDYGAKSKKKWSAKHDTILVYVKNPKKYYFNSEEVDREPYMAPGMVTPEKAERGKLPTDVWWHTIVPTNGKERTGYPTQKPIGILKRMITASSKPGDVVLDFFGGSGSTGEASLVLGRKFILVDESQQAIDVMRKRFTGGEGDKEITRVGELQDIGHLLPDTVQD